MPSDEIVVQLVVLIVSLVLAIFVAITTKKHSEKLAARLTRLTEDWAKRATAHETGGDVTLGPALVSAQEMRFVALLDEYQRQALFQAWVLFWCSVIASTAGFVLIVVAFISSYFKGLGALTTVTGIVPGAVIGAVGGLFSTQATELRNRVTALYDRFRRDRKRIDAEAIARSINNQSLRDVVFAEISLHVAGLTAVSATELRLFFGADGTADYETRDSSEESKGPEKE